MSKYDNRIERACNGVHSAQRDVKPTMSLKYIVTQEKLSAATDRPNFRSSAMGLKKKKKNYDVKKRIPLLMPSLCRGLTQAERGLRCCSFSLYESLFFSQRNVYTALN